MLLAAMTLGAVVLAGTVVGWERDEDGWNELMLASLADHPDSRAEDVYKFVHQSVFGPAHLITDRAAAQRYLMHEIAALTPAFEDEPLVESLSVTPPLVRVNLRPYVAMGGDTDALLDALVASANEVRGDAAVMTGRLVQAAECLRGTGRHQTAEELERLAEEQAAVGFPALHHSVEYARRYRPAYRVVLLPLIQEALPRQSR